MSRRLLRHENLALDPPPGVTLAERVAKGPLAPSEARRLARDVCAALEYAHGQGMVHGNLGADSVVLDGERWVVVGFAARGADAREDVRAVGALLYQALTGSPPVAGARTLALPRGLRAPILRSLQEAPERRYGTIAEMAVALGVAPPAPPRRRRRIWPLVALGIVAAGLAGVARYLIGRGDRRPVAIVAPTPEPPAPAPAPAPARRVLAIGELSAPADAAWLGPVVAEMLAAVLDEVPSLEVVRAGGGLVLTGTIEHAGAGWLVAARIVDTASHATLAAERIAAGDPGELVVRVGELAARLAGIVAPGTRTPALATLTSGSAEAWQAYGAGDEAGIRRAIAIDPKFFQAWARLATWLHGSGQTEEAEAAVATARPLAAHAGSAGMRALARLAARTPAERVAALELERAHAPHDLAIAAELAAAYRAAGRVTDCAAEAERAGAPGARDLASCRLAAGDATGALAAATASDDPLLAGDVALGLGRFAEAREAYRKAGARAGARPALVALRAQGRCKTVVHPTSVDDARIAMALAIACGDPDGIHAAEAAARKLDPRAGDDLAVLRAAVHGEPRAFARAQARAADEALWSADGLDRGRRYGPVFAAARSERRSEALAGFSPAPSDRWGLFEEPLLFEVALTQADLGSAEDAALACDELDATTPLALYCHGRAAEAAADWPGAFRAYREFLDRWSDADPDHRLVREAIRRSKLAAAKARAPAP